MKVGFVGITSFVFSPLPIKNRRANATIENNVFDATFSALGCLTNLINKIVCFFWVGSEISRNIEGENPAIAIRIMV